MNQYKEHFEEEDAETSKRNSLVTLVEEVGGTRKESDMVTSRQCRQEHDETRRRDAEMPRMSPTNEETRRGIE